MFSFVIGLLVLPTGPRRRRVHVLLFCFGSGFIFPFLFNLIHCFSYNLFTSFYLHLIPFTESFPFALLPPQVPRDLRSPLGV